MALKLELPEQPNGFSFPEAYVKVSSVSLDVISKIAVINTYFYKDEAAREAGKEPIAMNFNTCFQVRGDDYDSIFAPDAQPKASGPQALCYAALKLLPFFKGAVDI